MPSTQSKSASLLTRRILDARLSWANFRPEQFVYVPCTLCGSFDYETKASLVINWVEFFIVQCNNCKLTWRNPMPDTGFLRHLYAENYFDVRNYPNPLVDQVGIADTEEADQLIRREKSQQEIRKWIGKGILPNNNDNRSRKLLEIGGGCGYLQRAAEEEGWNTLGLEISPHGIKDAIDRGLTIIPIVLDELCDKYVPYSKFFDLIVFFDFLEHVTDPGRVLRMVHSILKDDGTVILRVPCIQEDDCPMYHLIDHIWHFSERTLETILNRENFIVFDRQQSGRFPGEEGQVQNMTFFAKKS